MTLHFRPCAVRIEPWAERRSGSGFSSCRGTGVLDIAGPWEVLGHANDVLGRPAYELEAARAARAGRRRRGTASSWAGSGRCREPARACRTSRSWRARRCARCRRSTRAWSPGCAGFTRASRPSSRSARAPSCSAAAGAARRPPRHHALDVPRRAARALSRGPRRRRGHLRQGRRRLDVGGHHRRHRSDAGAGRGGPRPPRGDGGRPAAGAVPAPFGEPGAVQLGAAAAGEGAAQAARHLDVRPRARRRAAAGRADRARGSA